MNFLHLRINGHFVSSFDVSICTYDVSRTVFFSFMHKFALYRTSYRQNKRWYVVKSSHAYSELRFGIYIGALGTPRRYDRFVSLAGGQAEIAPGANPGSKIRGFGSSKHLDEGHQSRARASLRAGTSRLTERGEKGGKNGEMTRVGAILRDHGVSPAGVFARVQVPRERDSRTQIFNHPVQTVC